MIDFEKLAGEKIASLIAYKPGKPIDELKRELNLDRVVKLASNENPFGPSKSVIDIIQKNLINIPRYPDGSAYELRKAVSEFYGVSGDELLFGAGSNEIIELLLRTFVKSGEHVISPAPSFSVYGIISQAMGSQCIWIPSNSDFTFNLDAVLEKVNDKTRVIFLANPNNPTGTYIKSSDLESFMSKVPQDVIVVMDEAYIEFSDAEDMPDTLSMYKRYENMVLMRTFSKAYGLAGLRIGYSISNEKCSGLMDKVRQPFNSNLLAQASAIAAIKDQEWLNSVVKRNLEGRKFLYNKFNELGLKYIPTQANFILVNVKDGEKMFNELLHRGVIVRFMGSSLKEYIRVSIGTEDENIFFINALSDILK